MNNFSTLRKSLKFKLVTSTLVILIPLVFFLVFDNFYSISLIRQKVAQSNMTTISLYLQRVDQSLTSISGYLLGLYNMQDLSELSSRDDAVRFFAYNNIKTKLENDINLYSPSYSLFVYNLNDNYLVDVYNGYMNFFERSNIKNSILQLVNSPNGIDTGSWFLIQSDNQYFIFRVYKIENIYIGSCIKVSDLVTQLETVDFLGDATLFFSSMDGIPLINAEAAYRDSIDLRSTQKDFYLSGRDKKYVVIGKDSATRVFRLSAAIPDESILSGLDSIQTFLMFFAFLSLLFIPLLLTINHLWVMKPLSELESAFMRVQDGDIRYKISTRKYSSEFNHLNSAFNHMIENIERLKIEVYEKQLEKQKTELRYLQSQLKPHFILNTLNSIYSLAYEKDYDGIQKLSKYLASFLRYTLRQDFSFITIKEEISNVMNYLEIIRLRYPHSLTYCVDIEEGLENAYIPPFTVHTFAENIIKHVLDKEKLTVINIKILSEGDQNSDCMQVMICDNGDGIPADVLERFDSAISSGENSQEHVGIFNTKRRLDIIYGSQARLELSNSEVSGAIIKMVIPKRIYNI